MTRVRRLGVVIPARDEEELIGECLASVLAAVRVADVPTSIVVVADGCLDATAERARRFAGVEVVEVQSSNVGAARAVGVRHAIAAGADWIANTDADSVVPAHWLARQLAVAERDVDVVVGTVRPDFTVLTIEHQDEWLSDHVPGEPNGHVHGANLGFRASTYRAAGGYRPLPEHEDVDLVARLATLGTLLADDTAEVITSARPFGRTPGGYARYLRERFPARGTQAPETQAPVVQDSGIG